MGRKQTDTMSTHAVCLSSDHPPARPFHRRSPTKHKLQDESVVNSGATEHETKPTVLLSVGSMCLHQLHFYKASTGTEKNKKTKQRPDKVKTLKQTWCFNIRIRLLKNWSHFSKSPTKGQELLHVSGLHTLNKVLSLKKKKVSV